MKIFSNITQDKEVLRNLKILIGVQSTGLILPQVLFRGGVLSLFILQIGGGAFEIGLAFSLFTGLNLLRVFIGPYIDYYNKRNILFAFWLTAAFVSIFILLTIPVYSRYGKTASLIFLFIGIIIYRLVLNIGDAAWIPLVSEVIPAKIKGRFLSVHRMTWQSFMFAGIIIAGIFLGKNPSVGKFYSIFIFAVIFHFMRPFIIRKVTYTPVINRGERKNIFTEIKKPLKNKQFQPFILFTAVSTIVLFIVEPFIVPFLKNGLGIPASYTLYISSGIHVGSIVSLAFWGKFSDRYGNRFIFFITNITIFILLLLTVLIPKFENFQIFSVFLASLISILYGIAFSGFRIGALSRMFSESPPEEKGTYINLWVSIWGFTSLVVPAAAGKILVLCEECDMTFLFINIDNYKLVFLISSLLVFVSIYLIKKMKPIDERGLKSTIFEFINFGTNRY